MTGAAIGNEVLRGMYEGTPLSIETIAQATGRSEAKLRRIAEREGWGSRGKKTSRQELDRRLMALADRLVEQLEALAARAAEDEGSVDRREIEMLSAMLKMAEKLGELTRGPERAKEKQIETDVQMSAALARIDARIFTLARELAAEMGGAAPDGQGDGTDP